MQFLEEYQTLTHQLMKSGITYTMNMEEQLIEIDDFIGIEVEEGWTNEAVSYCVASLGRGRSFNLDEVDKVITEIQSIMSESE